MIGGASVLLALHTCGYGCRSGLAGDPWDCGRAGDDTWRGTQRQVGRSGLPPGQNPVNVGAWPSSHSSARHRHANVVSTLSADSGAETHDVLLVGITGNSPIVILPLARSRCRRADRNQDRGRDENLVSWRATSLPRRL